jgi:hypothetical protein
MAGFRAIMANMQWLARPRRRRIVGVEGPTDVATSSHLRPTGRLVAAVLALSIAGLAGCGETTIAITDPVHANADAGSPPVDLELGLLAYLPLDETEAGALASDASGNGHDGTPSVNPPVPSMSVPPTGFPNPRSLNFDGAQQFLDLGRPPGLDVVGTVTLAAWVSVRATDGFRNVIAHGWHHAPDQELALRIQDNIDLTVQPAPLYGFVTWDGEDHAAVAVIPEGDLESWHHLCGVYDGENYRLYRDGELMAEHADAVAPMRVEEAWSIGARGMPDRTMPDAFDPRYFDGWIDDVRIYDRALSDAEVRALYWR